jgi:2-haloacid dehalogenase
MMMGAVQTRSLHGRLAMSEHDRRSLHLGVTAVTAAGVLADPGILATNAQAQAVPTNLGDSVKALVFDVFGTVVDWRNGVAHHAEATLKPLGYSLDWLAFADAWRAQYQPGMDEVRTGKIPFVKLDIIHRRMLERILPQFGLEKLDPKVLDELNLACIGSTPGRTSRPDLPDCGAVS